MVDEKSKVVVTDEGRDGGPAMRNADGPVYEWDLCAPPERGPNPYAANGLFVKDCALTLAQVAMPVGRPTAWMLHWFTYNRSQNHEPAKRAWVRPWEVYCYAMGRRCWSECDGYREKPWLDKVGERWWWIYRRERREVVAASCEPSYELVDEAEPEPRGAGG